MSAIQYAAELLVKRALEQDPDLPKDALWNVSSGGKAVMALTFIVCAVIIVAVCTASPFAFATDSSHPGSLHSLERCSHPLLH